MNYELFLKEKHIKITKGRIIILQIVCNSPDAICAEYIYEECKKYGNNIDLSTVYRSLELFEQKGIVNKFDLGNGKYNYRLKVTGHKHIIQCSLCHKEVEIDCPMTQVEELIKNKTGFILLEHELKMKAICKECVKISEKANQKKDLKK